MNGSIGKAISSPIISSRGSIQATLYLKRCFSAVKLRYGRRLLRYLTEETRWNGTSAKHSHVQTESMEQTLGRLATEKLENQLTLPFLNTEVLRESVTAFTKYSDLRS